MRRYLRMQRWFAPTLAALVAAGAAAAVEPAPTSSITDVAALIAAAEQADAGLHAIDARRLGAEVARRRAGRWEDPRLQLEGGRLQSDADDHWRVRGVLMQRLPVNGERAAGIALAVAAHNEIESAAVISRRALTTEVRHLVVRLRQALAHEQVARTAQADSTAAFNAVRIRLASGEARDADVLAAQIDGDEAGEAVELAAQHILAVRTRLARRCAVKAADIGEPEPLNLPSIERTALATATAHHPRLRLADASLQSAEAVARSGRATRWGDVRGGVFAERDGDANEVGLVVEVPLPLWNRNSERIATAEAAVRAAGFTRSQVMRQVEADAEDAWFTWDAARLRAEHHEAHLLPAARQALALSLADYSAGRSDLASVLTARRTLSRLARETADAAAGRDHALVDLHAAISGPEGLP
jgi:outer membrane protein, heavy metal efflux system